MKRLNPILILITSILTLQSCGSEDSSDLKYQSLSRGPARTIAVTSRILKSLAYRPVNPISKELLDASVCVSISRVWAASVIWGGQGSLDSVISCKLANGSWSAPAFSSFGGPSFGAQIGFSTTDVVHLYMNPRVSTRLKQNNRLSFGVGIKAVAGNVGLDRNAIIENGIDVVVYSSRYGLTAGIAAEANWIGNAPQRNQSVYKTTDKPTILAISQARAPAVTLPLIQTLRSIAK